MNRAGPCRTGSNGEICTVVSEGATHRQSGEAARMHPFVHRRPATARQAQPEFKLRPPLPLPSFCDRSIRREVEQEFREARDAGRNR